MHLFARLTMLLIVAAVASACGPKTEVRSQSDGSSSVHDSAADVDQAVVVRVVDGDTLVVRLGASDTTVRLLNVDAPETKDPNEAVECLGPEASDFLEELLPAGTAVELEYDGERHDRYGRTLAGVWLPDALVNAEVARAGLGVPVQFNGQVKFLPAVEEAARDAKSLKKGAYADHVSCALPARVDASLAAMREVEDPREQTTASYAAAISSLTSARNVANNVRKLARTARRSSGTAAWVFHDAVRDSQQARVESGISGADDRLTKMRSTMSRLKRQEEAAGRRRQREQERREQERAARQAEAERDRARQAETERERQENESQQDSYQDDDSNSGGANPPGYTGPRCYEPGGKVWHPC
jgi:endonuclease YncB( thermonuclease family)